MTLTDALLNPFGIDPAGDYPFAPPAIEGWTEHYLFYGYDPVERLGVFFHVGRLPDAPEVWRGVSCVYLPDGELLAIKHFGRGGTERGPGAAPLAIAVEEPQRRWSVRFDGAAHRTTSAALATAPLRDGPQEPVACDLVFEAAAPVFGKQHDRVDGDTSGSFHIEQILRMSGSITVRGRTVAVNGMGVRDHSSGTRDYGPVLGTLWFHALFPSGKAIQTQVVRFEQAEIFAAYIYPGDGRPLEKVEVVEHPQVDTLDTPDGSVTCDPLQASDASFRIVLKSDAGTETLDCRLLGALPITLAAPMEEWIGTDLDHEGALQMCECPVEVVCDGETGTGLRERVSRVRKLAR